MANEKRLIDARELKSAMYLMAVVCNTENIFIDAIIDEIDNADEVDAVEVVRGRWLYDSGSGRYFCSACDEYALSFKKDTLYGGDLYEIRLTDYCPNCGAKMDGEMV